MPANSKPPDRHLRQTSAFSALRRALLQLVATRDGFEGLAGRVIERLSGGLIRLMPSGLKDGTDGLSGAGASPRLAKQAKRYGDKSALKLGELMSEMDRASSRYAFVETWVLVTTKTLLARELEALEAHAEQLGWTFVVLDWTNTDGVPRLAAACAALGAEALALIEDPAAQAELASVQASGAGGPPRRLTAVAAVDKVVFRYRRQGAEVELIGMNQAGGTLVDQVGKHDKRHLPIGEAGH